MSNSASPMCGEVTYGQSAFCGSGVVTNVMYGKSVIYGEKVIYGAEFASAPTAAAAILWLAGLAPWPGAAARR